MSSNLLFLSLCLVLGQLTFAQNRIQSQFLEKSRHRPTTAEILNQGFEALLPMEKFPLEQDDNVKAIEQGLPDLIAGLEKAYPGAIFAFLGRDMSLTANGMEAVYYAYGEQDRIRYINLSTPIFEKMTTYQMALYLKSLGLSDKKDEPRSFVIVDYTSMGAQSQSTQLATAAVSLLRWAGFNDEEIVDRFNVMTLQSKWNAWDPLKLAPKLIQQMKRKQVKELESEDVFSSIMRTSEDRRGMAYSSEWHGTFDSIKKEEAGLVPTASVIHSRSNRAEVYEEITTLIRQVLSQSYLADLEAVLKRHGLKLGNGHISEPANELIQQIQDTYDVHLQRVAKTLRTEYQKTFDKLIRETPLVNTKARKDSDVFFRGWSVKASSYVGQFSETFLDFFESSQLDNNIYAFDTLNEVTFDSILKLSDLNKIKNEEFAILFEMLFVEPDQMDHLLGKRSHVSERMLQTLKERLPTSEGLQYLFGSRQMRENFPTVYQSDWLKAFYDKLIKKEKVRYACRYLY